MEATTAARLADYMYIWNSVCGWQLRRRGGGPLLSDSIGRWPTLALVDRTAIDEQRSQVRANDAVIRPVLHSGERPLLIPKSGFKGAKVLTIKRLYEHKGRPRTHRTSNPIPIVGDFMGRRCL
jgi:hypothetical protein